MCKYCEITHEDDLIVELKEKSIGVGNLKNLMYMDLFMDNRNHKLCVLLENIEAQKIAKIEVKIKHCPFCGRKL